MLSLHEPRAVAPLMLLVGIQAPDGTQHWQTYYADDWSQLHAHARRVLKLPQLLSPGWRVNRAQLVHDVVEIPVQV